MEGGATLADGPEAHLLGVALKLFNQRPVAAVSMQDIAAAAGVGHDDLPKDYRRKRDMIRALFSRLAGEWNALLSHPEGARLSDAALVEFCTTSLELFWKYRFFYRELTELLASDPQLAEPYLTLSGHSQARFAVIAERFVASGTLRPFTDLTEINELFKLCWLAQDYWLTTLAPEGETLLPEQLDEGRALLCRALEPYLTDEARGRLKTGLCC